MSAGPEILFVSDPDHPLHTELLLVWATLKRHFALDRDLASAYKNRSKEPSVLRRAVDLCRLQIAMSEQTAATYRRDHDRRQGMLRAVGGRSARPFALPGTRDSTRRRRFGRRRATAPERSPWFGDHEKAIARLTDDAQCPGKG